MEQLVLRGFKPPSVSFCTNRNTETPVADLGAVPRRSIIDASLVVKQFGLGSLFGDPVRYLFLSDLPNSLQGLVTIGFVAGHLDGGDRQGRNGVEFLSEKESGTFSLLVRDRVRGLDGI